MLYDTVQHTNYTLSLWYLCENVVLYKVSGNIVPRHRASSCHTFMMMKFFAFQWCKPSSAQYGAWRIEILWLLAKEHVIIAVDCNSHMNDAICRKVVTITRMWTSVVVNLHHQHNTHSFRRSSFKWRLNLASYIKHCIYTVSLDKYPHKHLRIPLV